MAPYTTVADMQLFADGVLKNKCETEIECNGIVYEYSVQIGWAGIAVGGLSVSSAQPNEERKMMIYHFFIFYPFRSYHNHLEIEAP